MEAAPHIQNGEPTPRAWRSLRAVLTVQTQNAFNDNVVRFALMGIAFIVLKEAGENKLYESYKNIIGVLISLPFVIFAPIAGWTSDRFSKRSVITACLYAQIAIIGLIIVAVLLRSIWFATAAFFVLAIQSAFFGPAKLGIMKELVGSRKLAVVSGWMQMLAIVAIVFGSPVGGGGYKWAQANIVSDPWLAGLVPIGLVFLMAFVALIIARRIQKTAVHPTEPWSANICIRHLIDLKEVFRFRPVKLSAIGISFFWFSGAFAIAVFTQISQDYYADGAKAAAVSSYCLASSGIGIMIGSVLVAFVSSNRVELGLVPLGGIGMAVSSIYCMFFPPSSGWLFFGLVLFGATSAIFLVPLNAFLQDKADPARRGRVLSASNLMNSVAALFANALQYGLQIAGLSSRLQLLLLGIGSVIAAVYSLKLLPANFLHLVLKWALCSVYRIRKLGDANIPEKGGVLFISNHVSWIDALLIGAASPRRVRFVAYEGFFKSKAIGWFLRLFDVIPISATQARQAIKATSEALEEGSVVCLFPEGTLTRHGGLNELQKGFELIARQAKNCPVIPVYLDNLWGSIFSFSESKFFYKRPRRFPYPVTVAFGEPLKAQEAKRERVREAMLKLSVDAYRQRPELHETLDRCLIKSLKRKPRYVCFVDRSEVRRTRFTKRMTLATSRQLAVRWRESILDKRVGVALPPSSPSLFAHTGLALAGKVAVNLPLEIERSEVDSLRRALAQAEVKTVITTKRAHEALAHLPWPERVVYLTDELRAVDGMPRLKERIKVALLPGRFLRLAGDRDGDACEEEAAAVLDQTADEAWRYRFLSHRQVATLCSQIGDANIFRADDSLLNLYAMHQLEGQLFGHWLPLLNGVRSVVHTMGSHPATAQALINDEQVSALVAAGEEVPFFLEAVRHEESAVRMITTFDSAQSEAWNPLQSHERVAVCHGWFSNKFLDVMSLSMPHPESDVEQTGYKEAAVGRALPGTYVASEGSAEAPEPLLGHSPCTPSEHRESELGALGHIDPEGFLFITRRENGAT